MPCCFGTAKACECAGCLQLCTLKHPRFLTPNTHSQTPIDRWHHHLLVVRAADSAPRLTAFLVSSGRLEAMMREVEGYCTRRRIDLDMVSFGCKQWTAALAGTPVASCMLRTPCLLLLPQPLLPPPLLPLATRLILPAPIWRRRTACCRRAKRWCLRCGPGPWPN